MPLFTKYHTYLGSPPLKKWILCWFFAVLIPTGAWYLSQAVVIPGIIAVGISPFVALFLFFNGLNAAARSKLFLLTAMKAKKLGIVPTWGSGSAGYILVDDTQHLWAANGEGGELKLIEELQIDSTSLAHTISILRANKINLIIGFDSPQELEEMHERFIASLKKIGKTDSLNT